MRPSLIVMAYFVWIGSGFGIVLTTVCIIAYNSVLHYQPK